MGLGKVWSVLKVRPERLIIPVRLVTISHRMDGSEGVRSRIGHGFNGSTFKLEITRGREVTNWGSRGERSSGD